MKSATVTLTLLVCLFPQKHYREAEAVAVRASVTTVTMNEEEEGTSMNNIIE